QNKERREREYLQRAAERREAVNARQNDEEESERRQVDGQVRDSAAEHVRQGAAAVLRQRHGRQQCGADQQRLLEDQQEGRRHDVAAVAADRVEDRLQQEVRRTR